MRTDRRRPPESEVKTGMMKKWLSVLLALSLLLCALPALSEEEADSVDFRLSLRLNRDAFAPPDAVRATGCADLLDALRFEGAYSRSRSSDAFDLQLSVIPLDPDASPLDLHFFGTPAYVFMTSPLLGDQQVVFSNESLLEFCAKGYAHLGVPFHQAAFLCPYVWSSGLGTPVRLWKDMTASADENGVIPASEVSRMAEALEDALDSDNLLSVFTSTLGLGTDAQETVEALFAELPSYLTDQLTAGGPIQIRTADGEKKWSAACGDFAKYLWAEGWESLTVSLPEISGYLPSLLWERSDADSVRSERLEIRLSGTDGDHPDLLDFRFFADALPLSLPADCQSRAEVRLTGGIYPNFSFTVSMSGLSDGSFSAEVFPEGSSAALLSAGGSVVPSGTPAPVYPFTWDEFNRSTDLFRVNDKTLAEFEGKVIAPFVSGFVRFLFGIPTTSCQVFLDALEDSGVLALILGK